MTLTDDIAQTLGVLPRVESALHGPAHPDEFRVKEGRWGDRFYHDPLPGCDLAPACDDTWPSVSGVKKAADRDWTWTSLERAAAYLEARRNEIDGLNAAEIHTRLLEVNKAGLNRASGRGTSIHHVMEALAIREFPPIITAEATPYLPAARAFIDDHQPDWVLSEAVAINRTVGYGGTLDAVIRLDGKNWLVDWKTRKPGKHAAYPEEAWQLAAYAHADYIIVDRNGQAARAKLPPLDGGLVVSIAPEGYRLYPVNLDDAWESFRALRAFWAAKQTTVVGKPVKLNGGARKAAQTAPDGPQPIGPTAQLVAYRVWILGRAETIKTNPAAARSVATYWPAGVPGLRTEHPHTEAELDLIAVALEQVETRFEMPFTTPDPRRPAPLVEPELPAQIPDEIDEGPAAAGKDVLGVIAQIDALPHLTRAALNGWVKEAQASGCGFSIRSRPSRRRLEIYRALLALVPIVDDPDVIRACFRHVLDGDVPVATLGAVIGSVTIDEAVRLAETAAALTAGTLVLHYRDDGSAHLTSESEQR